MSYEQLKHGVRWAIGETVGTSRNPNGSLHREIRVREYFDVPEGRITVEEWQRRAREAVLKAGDGALYDAVKAHCRRHCAWLKKETEVEAYALECLVDGAYLAWAARGEFNVPCLTLFDLFEVLGREGTA